MLEIKNLKKSFGQTSVLTHFNASVSQNCICLLEGANGTGKTTLLKLIKGMLKPDDGYIHWLGKPINSSNVTYVDANNRSFFHRLTVEQNLDYFLSLEKNYSEKRYTLALIDFFKVSHLLSKKFSDLSSGQMQLLSLIRGFSQKSDVLLMDESLVHVDESNEKKVFEFLQEYVAKKLRVVIYCSHSETIPGPMSSPTVIRLS